MNLTHKLLLPPTYGKIVEQYLTALEVDTYYDAFTLTDNFTIVQVKGIIRNNGRYHYHHNYDNSENELFITYLSGKQENRFWTTSFEEIESIRVKNIEAWRETLMQELKKYE
jgi:hypothetical protein